MRTIYEDISFEIKNYINIEGKYYENFLILIYDKQGFLMRSFDQFQTSEEIKDWVLVNTFTDSNYINENTLKYLKNSI